MYRLTERSETAPKRRRVSRGPQTSLRACRPFAAARSSSEWWSDSSRRGRVLFGEPERRPEARRPASGTADTAGGNPGLAQGDAAGKALPELTFTRFDGTTVKLDLRASRSCSTCGRPTVPCVSEMPAIQRVHEQRKDRVTIIGIDTDDPSRSAAKKLATKTGVTYDLAIDQSGQLAQALDFVVLPTTVLVDANGRVVTSHAGALDENRLTDLINTSFTT
jgi:peroxiredoxin